MNSRHMQYVSTITAAWFATCSHIITAWNSPAIAKLTSENSPLGVTLTSEEASWVASVPMLGFIVGSIISAYILNVFGPKKTLILAALPVIVSWMVIAFTSSTQVLVGMRCLAGFGDGFIVTALPLYMGEVADKDIRGGLTSTISIMNSLGNVFVYSIGPFISYKNLALLCAIIPIVIITVFVFMPDSPYFLCKNGSVEKSKHSLKRLIGSDVGKDELGDRFLQVQLTVTFNKKSKSYLRDVFIKRNYRRAILLITAMKVFTHLSGMSAVKSYFQTIIQSTESSISPEISSIIFGLVQIPSVLLAAFLMDRLGRKPLYILSATGSAISLTFECLFFYLQATSSPLISQLLWLPTLSLIVYLIIVPLGVTSVPFVLMGEVLPSDVKSFAAAFSTTVGAVVSFLSTKYFLPFSVMYGMHTMFFVYACACVCASIFALYVLPETKGKSFLEIQEILKTKSCC